MKNVQSLFIPTTDYTVKDNNPTSYKVEIIIERLTQENINDVLGDIKEVILAQMLDNLTPSTERNKKVLTEIK